MAIRISVRNLNKGIRVNLKAIEDLARTLLSKEFKKKNVNLGLTFVDNAVMRKINYRFRRRKETTDILTFSYGATLAEIVISTQEARANARRFNTGFKKELILYVIHGILHYLGFKDNTRKTKSLMEKKEEGLLKKYGKTHLCR